MVLQKWNSRMFQKQNRVQNYKKVFDYPNYRIKNIE